MIDYEREKKEIETAIAKKEKEVSGQQSSLEDEQNQVWVAKNICSWLSLTCFCPLSQVAKLQKQIKEMQSRIEANEEELEAERQARSKAEKQKGSLAMELDDLAERLDEAGGATAAQVCMSA